MDSYLHLFLAHVFIYVFVLNLLFQIYDNSLAFNGPHSPYTEKARELVNYVDRMIFERRAQLAELEGNIKRRKIAEGVPVLEDEEFSLNNILERQSNMREISQPPLMSPMGWPMDMDSQSMGGEESDRPMTASVVLGDDDETRAGFGEFRVYF